jgi:hypothetical protein
MNYYRKNVPFLLARSTILPSLFSGKGKMISTPKVRRQPAPIFSLAQTAPNLLTGVRKIFGRSLTSN